MRVISVGNKEFRELCSRLLGEVKVSGYDFDIVVAIARGGVRVAEQIFGKDFYTVVCQRRSTPLKQFLKSFLSILPSGVTSFLRITEARLLKLMGKAENHHAKKPIELDEKLRCVLSEKNHKILIVDDAADSGTTLLRVVGSLRYVDRSNEIRTAVITSTRKNQLISPDYAVYRDGTLIRFPWAPDAGTGNETTDDC